MKAYYSHPKTYKNSKESVSDKELLISLGYEVIDPYDPIYTECWQSSESMSFSKVLIDMADIVAFRALSTGKIGAGVGKELRIASEMGKKIMEVPTVTSFELERLTDRILTIDETVDFFNTVGK